MFNSQDFTDSKSLNMFQKTSMFIERLLVWVFVPHRITEQGMVSLYGDEIPLYQQELTDVFEALDVQWEWKPVTFENLENTVDELDALRRKCIPVVLNYCVGDEDPNYPGTQVYKLLEKKGIPSTGANAASIELCTSKIRMKQAFIEAGVPTAPHEIINNSSAAGVCDRLGTPLIVKPALSFGSRGLSLQSVVHSDEQLIGQVQRLLSGQHGMQFSTDSIFVEQFINGSEFTVLLIGSAHQPESIKIYPPMERVFQSNLPETERFLSHNRYYGKCEEESPLSPEEPLYHCQLVDPSLHNRLCDLAKRAYCAVGGNGFGRVDIRMDKASQQLFVLEVNPACDITSDQRSSVGKILHLSGTSFAQLILQIIAEALTRYSTELYLVN